jgi:two-component system KDP operon response regulator KdpE|tara:strand:- start:118819 stop:119505 length:687 start_codon:yes stop_codon:yes gene_type:complete
VSRILVIDDEPQIRRFLSIGLESQGYTVVLAEDARAGLQALVLEQPDLVIMDLGLPDMDGQALLLELRAIFAGPVLILSVRSNEREKVSALDNGANDYVEKPFGVAELLARVRSLLRHLAGREPALGNYHDGYLAVDFPGRRVAVNGTEVHLSRKEFELLRQLMEHPGRIVTQQQLLDAVWGPGHREDTHYLRVFIGRLRAKLGDPPTAPQYIQTETGVGYRFLGQGD